MDVLRPHFTIPQLNIINKIRQHLKVSRLSDICDITRKYILPNIKECVNNRVSCCGWPNQPQVTKFIPLWKQACNRLQTALNNRHLGNWINLLQNFLWTSNSSGSVISNQQARYHRYVIKLNANTDTTK